MGELERLAIFIQQTKMIKAELEAKKSREGLTRAEVYRLDMCNGDLKLYEPQLEKLRKQAIDD